MKSDILIMIVDDEPVNGDLLKQALEHQYETVVLESGLECLEQAPQLKPDIILLDVLMPDISGYETCHKLRDNNDTQNIPVIFISALDTLEDRLKGYDSGGDDYLSKPVDLEIVFKKITLALENRKKSEQLGQEIQEIQDAFMTALNMGAETGMVAAFIEKSFLAQNYEQLFAAYFDSMSQFDLNTAVQIRYQGELITLNSDGKLLSLEQELMLKAQYDGRILEFGRRVFFNYPHFSILVKNMPVDDAELYGRLKDHLIVIASASDARIQSIGTEINLKKHMNIKAIFEETQKAIEVIHHVFDEEIEKTRDITQQLGQAIEEQILFLGLEEVQEKSLMTLIDNSIKELIKTIENKDVINKSFDNIFKSMDGALEYSN